MITSASSSSERKSVTRPASRRRAVEIARETLRRRGEPGVFGKMRAVRRIMVEQRQRPGAARRERDRVDIEARHGSGRERGIVHQIAVVKLLHRRDGARRRMRHGRELAVAPDEHVAGAVRHAGMEQRDVRLDGGQQHDRIVIAERIVDHAPVRPVREDVGADQPAQRHERHALLGRLHRGVERRAGRILHPDGPAEDRGSEARRQAELAEADGRGFQRLDTAGADQQFGLQARGRQRDQVQPLHAAPDQRARRLHRHAGGFARHDQHRSRRELTRSLHRRLSQWSASQYSGVCLITRSEPARNLPVAPSRAAAS